MPLRTTSICARERIHISLFFWSCISELLNISGQLLSKSYNYTNSEVKTWSNCPVFETKEKDSKLETEFKTNIFGLMSSHLGWSGCLSMSKLILSLQLCTNENSPLLVIGIREPLKLTKINPKEKQY